MSPDATLSKVAGASRDIVLSMFVERLTDGRLGSDDDDFVLVEWKAEVGTHWIAPLHVHHHDDEAWYVISGQLGFRLGDDEVVAHAGSAVLARRGVPHTYRNAGDSEAVYLLVMPPRIAQLIEAIHQPGADIPALFRAHDSEILLAA
jgi:mannose-6-phosphate isomerase-like protein (cupin superfamily)